MLVVGLAAAFALAAPAVYAQMTPKSGTQTQAQPGTTAKASKADEKFLTEAMQGDLAEVQMGELAQQKGGNDRVREFGQTLTKDHGDHSKTLQQLGQQVGITLPTGPNAKQKAEHDRLAKLSGAQFDREFAKLMIDDHRRDISKYQTEAKKSGAIGDMAKETIPTLQHHLQMAQELTRPAPTTGSGGNSSGGMGGGSSGGMGGGGSGGGMRR